MPQRQDMTEIKKVLIATDLSDMSRNALAHARLIADKNGAELHVQHVFLQPVQVYGVSGMPIPEAPPPDVEDKIRKNVIEWCGNDQVVVAGYERDYSVPLAVKHYADEHDIDLIVTGTHARKGASRFFLGSVAAEIIRTTSTPVLVAGPEQAVRNQTYSKIMVAIDFSEASLMAFHQAMHLAKAFGSSLVAVHVVDIGNLPPYYPDDFAKVEMGHAKQALDDLLRPVMKDIEVEQIVAYGDPHKLLVETASGTAADLVVMGTVGLRGLKGLMTGSVADRVVRSASCPVMVVHNPNAMTEDD